LLIDIFPEQEYQIERREARLSILAFIFLLLSAIALGLAESTRLDSWSAIGSRWAHLVIIPLWVSGIWLIRRTLQVTNPSRDPYLLPVTFLLTGWGLLGIWRLAPEFGIRQTIWFVVAVSVLFLIIRGPKDLGWLRRYRYLWMLGGIGLVMLTLIFGANPSGGSTTLWLGCCGIYIQPSEPLRLILVAFLAAFLADRIASSPRWLETNWWISLVPVLLIWLASTALLFIQRDLGTGVLFLALLASLIYVATGRWQVLVAALILVVIGGFVGMLFFEVVAQRAAAWINPWADPIGGSYQIVQSLISIASGGLLGRGPGLGSPGFVPAAHTDFIFTALTEEWGFIGGIAIIGLYVILISRGIRTALTNDDPFNVFLSAGISIALGLQAVLIIGGTLRLIPLSGVTLPFVSYGGSSLLTSFIGLGLILMLSGRTGRRTRFSLPLKNIHASLLLIWAVLAVLLGWWTIYRSQDLVSRSDNPRRGVESRYSQRGDIVDRDGEVLAESVGEPGTYRRNYPTLASAHVVGFDSVSYGQSGIELSEDDHLRGDIGQNAARIWFSKLLRGFSPPGGDVRLTIDAGLQEGGIRAMEGKQGALVLIDLKSGDILSMVSSPGFDAAELEQEWGSLVNDERSPLLDRAAQSAYQPGTVVGPFLLAAAMTEGDLLPGDQAQGMMAPVRIQGGELRCAGEIQPDEVHNMATAVRHGCPASLLNLGELLGGEAFDGWMDRLGLTEATQIRVYGLDGHEVTQISRSSGLLHEVVGQGDLTISPLQLARAFSGLLREEGMPGLRVIDATRYPGGVWKSFLPLAKDRITVPEQVREGFIQALTGGDGLIEIQAEALAGEEGALVGWNILADPDPEAGWVLVVAIEGEGGQSAAEIGRGFLSTSGTFAFP
jgi:cell division protein FtsW (lipid II flippase)